MLADPSQKPAVITSQRSANAKQTQDGMKPSYPALSHASLDTTQVPIVRTHQDAQSHERSSVKRKAIEHGHSHVALEAADTVSDSPHECVHLNSLKEKLQAMMRGRAPIHADCDKMQTASSESLSEGGHRSLTKQSEPKHGRRKLHDGADGDEVAIVGVKHADCGEARGSQPLALMRDTDVSYEASGDNAGPPAQERLFVCLEFCQCVCFVEWKEGCRTGHSCCTAVLYKLFI